MSDLKVIPGDDITAARWNRLADRVGRFTGGTGAAVSLMPPTFAFFLNQTGDDLDIGRAVALNYDGVAGGAVYDIPAHVKYKSGEGDGETSARFTFPDDIPKLGITAQPIPNNETGVVVIGGQCIAKISAGGGGSGSFVMVDPQETREFKFATSGVARKLADAGGGYAVVNLRDSCNLWRYKATEYKENATEFEALLQDLNGVDFINVTIKSPFSIPCVRQDEIGLCYLAGAEWYALATTAALMGSPVVSKVILGSAENGGDSGGSSCEDGAYKLEAPCKEVYVFDKSCSSELSPSDKCLIGSIGVDVFQCLDLCAYICENCDLYACNPPPEGCTPCENVLTRAYGSGGPAEPGGVDTAHYEWSQFNATPPNAPWNEGAGFYTTGDAAIEQNDGVCRATYPIVTYDEGNEFGASTLTIEWEADPNIEGASIATMNYTQVDNNGAYPVTGTASFLCDAASMGIFETEYGTMQVQVGFRFDYAPVPLGVRFRNANPQLFRSGCACNDAARLLNSWQDELTPQRIKHVAELIARDNPDFDVVAIGQAIADEAARPSPPRISTQRQPRIEG